MKDTGLLILVTLVALLLGGLVGYQFSPVNEVEVTVEKVVEVPVNVTQLVEVPVEVEKDWVGLAVSAYFDEVEEDLDKYQEVSKVEVDDAYTVSFDTRRDKSEVKVTFAVEYRITDTLDDSREFVSETVEVLFREDKDPKVTVL